MNLLTLSNPVFAAYVIAATIMIFKTLGMAWLTVYRLTRAQAGYRSPEDERRSILNPTPKPGQFGPHEYVDRARRIHQNDLENVPFFLIAGLLFVLTAPSLWLAEWLFYGYAASRFLHLAAYVTARNHEVRATLWTVGVLILMYMTGASLYAGILAAVSHP
jgi:glutathione S-transferase